MSYLDTLFKLDKKVVLITGACGQLGQTLCQGFLNAGCRVIGADLSIENPIDGIRYDELDVTDKQAHSTLYETIIQQYGQIDILINNAGVSTFANFEERTEEDFDWVMDVNLKGVFLGIQAFVNAFDHHQLKQAAIINIASSYGTVSPDFRIYTDLARKNSEVYGATKAGVIQMTKYFAVHLAERNIRTNCISPGGILNPDNPQGSDFQKHYSFRTPMQRMGNSDEMLGALLYLASDAASYTTGQNITIDGGLTAW